MDIPHKHITSPRESNDLEASYYLHFYLVSALVSLKHIYDFRYYDTNMFENKCQYYHYYVDHLLYSIGQISERFRVKNNPSNKEKDYYVRRSANRINYGFDDVSYPILSDKSFRNTIEHIDEHNINIINKHDAVGGFNVIEEGISEDLKELLLKKRNIHPYILDLILKRLYIERNGNSLTLNLEDLEQELIQLKKRVDDFWKTY